VRGHPASDVVEVRLVAGQRAGDEPGAGQRHRGRVRLERGHRHDDLVAGLEGGERQEADELVGAVADHELGGGDAEPPAQRGAQRDAAAVRVEVRARGLAPDRLDHAGRRPQRVLVGRQAHQLGEAELAHQRLERLARIVGGDLVQHRAPQPSRHSGSSMSGPRCGGTNG
jgi:hypothetical protein